LSEMCPRFTGATRRSIRRHCSVRIRRSSTFGTAAYVAVLEPDLYSKLVVHVPLDTYHKAEAREMRDAAWIAGQTPLKPSEIAIVDGVRDAIQHRPDVARLG
jgi:hypothetical protein